MSRNSSPPKAQADLTEAMAKVVLEEKLRTKAETMKLTAETAAEGEKKSKLIAAEAEKSQGRDRRQDRRRFDAAGHHTIPGQAEAKKRRARQPGRGRPISTIRRDSRADPTRTTATYSPRGCPVDMQLGIFYAGPGTFWTDLKGIEQGPLLGKIASESSEKPKTQPIAAPAR